MAEIKSFVRKPDPVLAIVWDGEDSTKQLLRDWIGTGVTVTDTRVYLPVPGATGIVMLGMVIVKFENGDFAFYETETFEQLFEVAK